MIVVRTFIRFVFIIGFIGTAQQSHATEAPPQFSYLHQTELAFNKEAGFKIDKSIENVAYTLNHHMNQSILFDSSFIRQPEKVREYHLKEKHATELVGQTYEVYTDDGVTLGATLFDRGSDTLLIVGPGFTNEREVMSPFISMFPGYDIALFDFRGHGWNPYEWSFNLTQKIFGVNGNLVTLGKKEELDVYAVVDGFKRLKAHNNKGKTYRRVIGLGLCYGAFIMAKSAAIYPGIFDKLILDGCWLSLSGFIGRAKEDLGTLCNPQSGGLRNHWFFGKQWVRNAAEHIVGNYLLDLGDVTLLDYAPKIKNLPILFFYGKDDYMIDRNQFEQLWNAFDVEKTVVLTSNHHVRNHLKQKELYKLICDLFIENTQDDMKHLLTDKQSLVEYYVETMRNSCLQNQFTRIK